METATASPFRLDGKVALVTGGANGIGIGIATVLAQAGAMVVIADRDEAASLLVVARLVKAGLKADWIALDLAEEASIVAACGEVVARHGAPWALVNNAGVQDRELLLEGTSAEWDRTHAINARGPFLMTREMARAMVPAGQGGRIVNIASGALRGSIIKGLASYTASKGALYGLSRASAFELVEHGITVNTVLPGAVITPGAIKAKGPLADGPARRKLPLGPICDPEDIGAAVLYFVSPGARYVTNQTIMVDAGFSVT